MGRVLLPLKCLAPDVGSAERRFYAINSVPFGLRDICDPLKCAAEMERDHSESRGMR